MSGHRRPILTALVLALAVGLAACDDGTPLTEPAAVAAEDIVASAFAQGDNAATTTRETFEVPFPPNPNRDFVPVFETCLGLDAPLRMSGTWTGWVQTVLIPRGRAHITEHIDYGQISITTASGDITWVAGPGASETIVLNLPLTVDDRGEAAFNVMHEFHARFITEGDAPDLRVSHRVRQLLSPNGELIKNEFVPFEAECIGGGQ